MASFYWRGYAGTAIYSVEIFYRRYSISFVQYFGLGGSGEKKICRDVFFHRFMWYLWVWIECLRLFLRPEEMG